MTAIPQDAGDRYYKPSGRFDTGGLILMIVVCLATGLIIGAAYGLICRYLPLIYLNFLATIGSGLALGFVAVLASRWGKVRNPALACVVALVSALLAVYVNWVIWLHAIGDWEGFRSAGDLLMSPEALLIILQDVAREGPWSLKSWTPTGWFLYILWIIEAVVVVGIAAGMALMAAGADPFCEACHRWTTNERFEPCEGPCAPLTVALEAGDCAPLASFTKLAGAPSDYVIFDLSTCPSCDTFAALSVTMAKRTFDKKGKESVNTETVVSNIFVDPRVGAVLSALPTKTPTTADEAAAGDTDA